MQYTLDELRLIKAAFQALKDEPAEPAFHQAVLDLHAKTLHMIEAAFEDHSNNG